MQYDLEMWKYARTMKRVSAIADAGHDHVPGTSARLMGVEVRINSTGQRNTEILRLKPDGVYRIVMLGDSLTFGWGVEEEQTSSRRLERMLNSARSSAKRVSIVNAGVGNYNTKMQAAWLVAEGDIYEPDMIILNYFINDAEPTPVDAAARCARGRLHSYISGAVPMHCNGNFSAKPIGVSIIEISTGRMRAVGTILRVRSDGLSNMRGREIYRCSSSTILNCAHYRLILSRY